MSEHSVRDGAPAPSPDSTGALWVGFGGGPSDAGTGGGPGGESLDRASGVPLHEQLAGRMRARIRSHEWEAGARIPSEHELCRRFGVARGTARRAIAMLADEGLLVQERGRGTFVSEPGIWHTSGRRLLSIAASLREQGRDFVTRVLDERVVPAPADVARELAVPRGSEALFLRRVRAVAGESVVCQEGWLNMAACPGIEESDFLSESAFDAVERCSGRRIADSRMRYTARAAGREHAAYLGCAPDAPMLVLEQVIRLEDGTPIEWSLTWLRDGLSILGSSVQDRGPGAALLPGEAGWRREPGADEPRGRLSRRELELRALGVRRGALAFALDDPAHPYHLGGSMSCAEILAVLLGDVMRTGADGTPWEARDRLVLSKGHAALALYPALAQAGLVSAEDLARGLYGPDAVLFKHPRRDLARGIEMSGGSLGLGPAHACGLVMANRRLGRSGRVFCVLGDGECNEGSVWESVAFAGHNRLGELTFVVDANGLQLDGPCDDVLGAGPAASLAATFASFGAEVVEVDGHDVVELRDALAATPASPADARPRVVVARTVKGRGISFMEGCVAWHDKSLTEEERRVAVAELDAREEEVRHG